MFQLDNATVTIYAVANARHKLRQLNALQVKQMLDALFTERKYLHET